VKQRRSVRLAGVCCTRTAIFSAILSVISQYNKLINNRLCRRKQELRLPKIEKKIQQMPIKLRRYFCFLTQAKKKKN
jgi:hypothetical protein